MRRSARESVRESSTATLSLTKQRLMPREPPTAAEAAEKAQRSRKRKDRKEKLQELLGDIPLTDEVDFLSAASGDGARPAPAKAAKAPKAARSPKKKARPTGRAKRGRKPLFSNGQQVFAKLKGWSWWPAKVEDDSLGASNRYRVTFYGDSSQAFVKENDLCDFAANVRTKRRGLPSDKGPREQAMKEALAELQYLEHSQASTVATRSAQSTQDADDAGREQIHRVMGLLQEAVQTVEKEESAKKKEEDTSFTTPSTAPCITPPCDDDKPVVAIRYPNAAQPPSSAFCAVKEPAAAWMGNPMAAAPAPPAPVPAQAWMSAPAAHFAGGPAGCMPMMQMPMQIQPPMNAHAQWDMSACSIPPQTASGDANGAARHGLSVHELLV